MSAAPEIAFGVPAYGSGEYIAEAIRSALAQTDVDVAVAVSVDGESPGVVEACRAFADDGRVQILQRERLGPARNYHAALTAAAATGADYVALLPDDDVLQPGYAAALKQVLDDAPEAAVSYSDIERFGARKGSIAQSTIAGTLFGRQMALLVDHFPAVAFRGLTRRSAFAAVPPLTGNAFEDFAVDTVWMARLATAGDLIRLPRPLYLKRYHSGSLHSGWSGWEYDRQRGAWLAHCIAMLEEALTVAEGGKRRGLLRRAAQFRLLSTSGPANPFGKAVEAASPAEREVMIAALRAVPDPER